MVLVDGRTPCVSPSLVALCILRSAKRCVHTSCESHLMLGHLPADNFLTRISDSHHPTSTWGGGMVPKAIEKHALSVKRSGSPRAYFARYATLVVIHRSPTEPSIGAPNLCRSIPIENDKPRLSLRAHLCISCSQTRVVTWETGLALPKRFHRR